MYDNWLTKTPINMGDFCIEKQLRFLVSRSLRVNLKWLFYITSSFRHTHRSMASTLRQNTRLYSFWMQCIQNFGLHVRFFLSPKTTTVFGVPRIKGHFDTYFEVRLWRNLFCFQKIFRQLLLFVWLSPRGGGYTKIE